MTHPLPPRRFTIADVMILTAAGAVGSLVVRSVWPGYLSSVEWVRSTMPGPGGVFVALGAVQELGPCFVIPLMAAQVVLRHRSPRPRVVRDEPGLVASLAVLVAMLPGLIWLAAIYHRPGYQRPDAFDQVWFMAIRYTSTAVPGAWLVLVLARRWRPRADWVDRFGRALGWFWVILLVVNDLALAYQALGRAIANWGLR